MKMTITRFSSKDIVTARGDATVLNFNAGGKWYSAFLGSWNGHWGNGTVIEIDPAQIKENTKNGKTFLNISAPAKAQSGNGAGNSANGNSASDRMVNGLAIIYKDLQAIKKKLGILDEK